MEKDSNEKKAPAYLTKISSETFDKLKEQLLQLMVVEKKYRDRHFTAKKLAEALHTNTRYVSIVLNVRYHLNYSQFVNRLRIEEAMALLADKRYAACVWTKYRIWWDLLTDSRSTARSNSPRE